MPLGARVIARWGTRLLAPALGLFFIVAAAAKALDPIAFAAQIEAYELISGAFLTRVLAWLLIAAEAAVGASLLFGVQRRPALLAATGLLVTFTAVSAWAWVQGQQHACGCFGALVERTPAETVFEDLALLAIVGLALRFPPAGLEGPAAWRRLAAVCTAIVGISIPPVVGRLNPALDTGKSLAEIGLETYLPSEPDPRTIYAFLEPLAIGADFDALQTLVYRGMPVVALCSADDTEIEAFRWSAGPAFELVSVSGPTLRRLSQDRTGAFLVEGEKVQAIWRGTIPKDTDLSLGASVQPTSQAAETNVNEEVQR